MAELKDPVEQELEVAMPWVGMYIAAASAVCTLAMAADAFNGFRRKRLWFPTKYFALNATTLTLLAVAMKLPMDLNTNMFASLGDRSAKYVSLTFMSTATANFMSSLGSMTDKEILSNVLALGILVITVAANVVFQIILLTNYLNILVLLFVVPTSSMLHLLVRLVSMAIMVPTIKRRLEAKYQELHKIALREENGLEKREAFRVKNLRREMMKYWVMAETSNPQFVMARSVVCSTSSCFFDAFILLVMYLFFFLTSIQALEPRSVYKSLTIWIQVIQFAGVVVGTIAPTLRWFAAVSFEWSPKNWYGFNKEFKVEACWVQILMDYRDSFTGSQIRKDKFRKYLHDVKWFAITFCIGIQFFSLLLTKLFLFFSVVPTLPLFACFALIKILVRWCSTVADDSIDLDLHQYVILFEGEPKLPTNVLKNMCYEANSVIQTGERKQPKSLLRLLCQFRNFNGVGRFDSSQIPSLHSQEPPNCWTLPVVTLTSIAIALPNITKHKKEWLLSSVGEGLSLAKIVEKTLCGNAELSNIRKGADSCWVGVLLYMKWLNINLSTTSVKCKNSAEVLQLLSKKAEEIIVEFKREERDPIMENHLNWPAKVVPANSMYKISRTILLSHEEDDESEPKDEELYERLSVMIADILAACLTNLPHAITTMCHHNAIEKREKSVRKAFLLLGKTKRIIEFLQQQEWPDLNHDKAAYIEEWRTLFRQNEGDLATSTSASSDESSEHHFTVTVDC